MIHRIIPRSEWGARYPAGFAAAPLPATRLYLHNSVTLAPDLVAPFDDDYAAIRTLERIGQERFGGGISYTFPITPAGLIFDGHGIGRRGAHTKGFNTTGRAICWVGNYDRDRPPAPMVDATVWLLQHGVEQGWWDEPRFDGGHRDAPGASTACPGRHAYALIGDINLRASAPPPRPIPAPRPAPEAPLMALTDADQALLMEAARSVLFGKTGERQAGPLALAVHELSLDLAATRVELAELRTLVGADGLDPAARYRLVADPPE